METSWEVENFQVQSPCPWMCMMHNSILTELRMETFSLGRDGFAAPICKANGMSKWWITFIVRSVEAWWIFCWSVLYLKEIYAILCRRLSLDIPKLCEHAWEICWDAALVVVSRAYSWDPWARASAEGAGSFQPADDWGSWLGCGREGFGKRQGPGSSGRLKVEA